MTDKLKDGPFTVGHYCISTLLGEGGNATTYLAQNTHTEEYVAVKSLQLVRAKHGKHIDLFEREADVLKALTHNQIPTFHATLVTQSEETITLYLVQDFITGRPLSDRLSQGDLYPPAEAVHIMLNCLIPLQYLHDLDPPLYHRDIKPSNIIMRDDGTCVLIDFGAVRQALADPNFAGSSVVGTFGYMAPEQFQARATAATDLYSLGATAVHLLTGRSPNTFEIKRLKPDIHKYLEVDPHLGAILDLLLEPAAEDRYQTCRNLRTALERWVADHQTEFDAVQAQFLAHQVQNAHVDLKAESARDALAREAARVAELNNAAPPPVPSADSVIEGPDPVAEAPEPEPAASTGEQLAAAAELPDPSPAPTQEHEGPLNGTERPRAEPILPRRRKEVPVKRSRDGVLAALRPSSIGYSQVGWLLLTLGVVGVLLALLRLKNPVTVLAPAGLFSVYGLSYLGAAWRRRHAYRGDRYLEQTDGTLLQMDVRTTLLGGVYVVLHYEFLVDGRRYTGLRPFPDRAEARPFLHRSLEQMIWYDEMNPRDNTLDRADAGI